MTGDPWLEGSSKAALAMSNADSAYPPNVKVSARAIQ